MLKTDKNNASEKYDVIYHKAKELALNAFFNEIEINFYWLDHDGYLMGCNEEELKILGVSSQSEVIGKHSSELFAESSWLNSKKVIETGESLTIEEIPLPEHGKNVTYLTIKSPIKDKKNNKVTGVIGVSIDISEKKQAEELMRTAKKAAEAANKAKSEFIANMSHDLRTPMAGVLGMLDVIQIILNKASKTIEPNSTPSVTEYQAIIEKLLIEIEEHTSIATSSSKELINFFNDILKVIQLDSTNFKPTEKTFNLRRMIQKNSDLFLSATVHKNLKFSYEVADKVPLCFKGFASYLERCLSNLVGNALKFTDKGYVKIAVSILESKEHYDMGDPITLEISVKDTGIGIAEDKFETVFEHFSRLTSSYEGVYKGSGLGLHTVKRYLQEMDGTIAVESKVGEGSCFTVRVPLLVAESDGDFVKNSDDTNTIHKKVKPSFPERKWYKREETNQVSETKSEHAVAVLVVEDNPPAAIAAQTIFGSLDCSTDLAKNGTQAVQMATDNDYALILMDVGLPDFSGIEATKQIRSLDNTKRAQVPIIALTGHGNDPKVRQEALDAGMQEVLTKPAQSPDLQAVLKQFVLMDFANEKDTNVQTDKTGDDNTVIDWPACVKQCNDDLNFTHEILSVFADDLKQTKEKLKKHYIDWNETALRAELHRVRGGLTYLTLPKLDRALKAFHEAVKKKPKNSKKLEKSYQAVEKAMVCFWEVWAKGGFK